MQAIILAAGMGKRLKKLTQDNTKCMVQVNGVTLIERMLRQLDRLGLSRVILVVGYQAEKLKEYIATLPVRTPVCYIDNPDYYRTNNIYSLWLARQELCEEDTILLESDLIFEDAVLDMLLEDPRGSLALVDKYESWMDGTCVRLNDDDTIADLIPGKKFRFADIPDYYKTVNIYKFSKHFSETHYVPFLDAYSRALGNNEYYEQVLRVITILDDPEIRAKRLNGQIWYEIDDVQDLDIAASMFAPEQERLARVQNRYGGYWRYPKMLDFCNTGNPYFPPERMVDELMTNLRRVITTTPSGAEVNSLLVAKNLGIDAQDTAVANGVEELIKSIASLTEGTIGVVKPINEEYLQRLKERETLVFVPADPAVPPTAEEIMAFYRDAGISLLIISNPNTHTGGYIRKDMMRQLLDWAETKGIRVLIDESYIDFVSEEAASFIQEERYRNWPHLLILKNLSAAEGLFGLRIGCAVSADREVLDRIRADLTIWNVNSVAEFYLQIAEKYQKDYRSALAQVAAARAQLIAELSALEGIQPYPSETDYVMCRITAPDRTAAALTGELFLKHQILIKDLTGRIPAEGEYVRIAVRSEEDSRRLIEALQSVFPRRSDSGRIVGNHCDIDNDRTHAFFEERTGKKLPHRYNYVIYQDSNPELALERDRYEKEKMLPFLAVREDSRILDIGCGVGRWADELTKHLNGGCYIGVDYSEGLLQIAKEAHPDTAQCRFLHGSFQQTGTLLKEEKAPDAYDVILINGVLMYINDDEIADCLAEADRLTLNGGRIYIKESVGIEKRFTLKDFYSRELTHNYNAIYRSIAEYTELLKAAFPEARYEICSMGETWKQEQENRKETTSYYWILKKVH